MVPRGASPDLCYAPVVKNYAAVAQGVVMRFASEEFRANASGGQIVMGRPAARRPSDAARAEKTRVRDYRAGSTREFAAIKAIMAKFEPKERARVRSELGEIVKRIPRDLLDFVNPDPSTAEDRSDARGGQRRPPSLSEGSADRVSALTSGSTRDDMREGHVVNAVSTIKWIERNGNAASSRRQQLMQIVNDRKAAITRAAYAREIENLVLGLRMQVADLSVSLDSAEAREEVDGSAYRGRQVTLAGRRRRDA